MKRRDPQFVIVLVTAPDKKSARLLGKAALEAKLAACANLIAGIESHYWWQGKVENSAEVLVLFKTSAKHLDRLERLIIEHHPYDTPEFVVLPIWKGNTRYLQWIEQSVSDGG